MSQAIIGIGIPGSGKTTYLKPLAARMGLPYVSLDDIRQELTGDAADHGQHARTLAGFCRRHGVDDITGIWFDTPLEVCLGRNRGRDRQVPEHALHRMQARLDAAPPTESEGFDRLEVRHD
jgi:predicted kinase